MRQYAENTTVPVERSLAEIKSTLDRYGATQFGYMDDSLCDPPITCIQFRCEERLIRFRMELPRRDSERFTKSAQGRRDRSADKAYAAWEQACRQRWRALCLCIKAKLESVEAGISQFEDEFLAFIVDPRTDRTVGEVIRPQLAHSYKGSQLGRLLLTREQ